MWLLLLKLSHLYKFCGGLTTKQLFGYLLFRSLNFFGKGVPILDRSRLNDIGRITPQLRETNGGNTKIAALHLELEALPNQWTIPLKEAVSLRWNVLP